VEGFGEKEGIENFAVLEDVGAETGFAQEAGFFEEAGGGVVGGEGFGVDANEIVGAEGPIGKGRDGFGHDALVPEGFAQPVTELGGLAMDVLAKVEADAADGFGGICDGKGGGRIFLGDGLQKVLGIAGGVGVRKEVAEVEPNVAVVGIALEGSGVVRGPGTDRAAFELKVHEVFVQRSAPDRGWKMPIRREKAKYERGKEKRKKSSGDETCPRKQVREREARKLEWPGFVIEFGERSCASETDRGCRERARAR
jgi:hypothetical protein